MRGSPALRGELSYLHAVSRWQLGATDTELNPLSPWVGEPKMYTLSSPGQPVLELHPSRVVRFLGNPLLGQSPSGLSATGESDVRNYYDMIAARRGRSWTCGRSWSAWTV